jgi:outer membrane protein assembly factor BamB
MMYLKITVLLLIGLNNILVAQDWPDWRGSNRDGVWHESGIIEKFKSEEIESKWTVPVGSGYSGPTVAKGKVYLTDLIEEPVYTVGVVCFDEQSGKKVWEYRYECVYEGIGYQAGPRASVVISEGKVYSLGSMGHLYCLDAENGKVIWQKDLNFIYEIKMPIWGIAATPLNVDHTIILQIGGRNNACVIALDKVTGEEVWRSLDEVAAYSSPVLIEKNSQRVVLVWTKNSLSGLNPSNGHVYWSYPWEQRSGMGIATPVFYNDYVFVSSFYNGSLLLSLGDDYTTMEKIWQRSGENERKTDALHCVMNTPVIIDNYIYGVDSYGELRCLELKTGNRVWEDQTAVNRNRWANIHFVQNKDKIWMLNEQGELLITQLSPTGFTEISRAMLIEPTKKQLARGVVWAHPAFANQHVFIRNDNKLICADLSK